MKRIVPESGSVKGFRAGCCYASHRSNGSRKTIWNVGFYTLETKQVSIPDGLGSPLTSDVEDSHSAQLNGPLVNLSFGPKNQPITWNGWVSIVARIKTKLIQLEVPVNAITQRRQKPFPTTMPTSCRVKYGECVCASLANALVRFVSTRIALQMLLQGPVTCRILFVDQL